MFTGANRYYGNMAQPPRWAADPIRQNYLCRFPAKLVVASFADQGGIPVKVTAIAAQGATSVTVTALALPNLAFAPIVASGNVVIPAGAVVDFGGAKFARLTADAKIGDTALTVSALPTALAVSDSGSYNWWNGMTIPSGTFVGRTFTERTANVGFGPADFTTPDDEIMIVAFDVPNARVDNDVALIRPDSGFTIKENYLPNFASFPGNQLTWLRAHHKCILGVD